MIINTNLANLLGEDIDTDLLANVAALLDDAEEDANPLSRLSTGRRITVNRVAAGLDPNRLSSDIRLRVNNNLGNIGAIVNQTQEFTIGTASRPWGAIYAQNGVIQTSDMNKKRLIKDSDLGLPFVMALKPVSFAWRNSTSTKPVFGFLGQDVEKALGGRGFSGLQKGDAGYSLRYVDFIAPMVKAMQQQQSQIDALKQEIVALKQALSK